MNGSKGVLWAIVPLLASTSLHAGDVGVMTGESRLELSGRVHAQFQTTSVDGFSPSSTFSIRRARLKATYENLSGSMTGRLQFDVGEGKAVLKDGYVDLKLSDAVRVRMGQFKKPFSLWELTSTTKIPVIERSNEILGTSNKHSANRVAVKDGGFAGRDIGVQVHGVSGRVEYAIGAFNGNGSNAEEDDDNGKSVGARLVMVAGNVRVGGALSNRTVSDFTAISGADTTVSSENFQAVEADLEYGTYEVEENGPWLIGEVQWGKNPQFGNTDTNFMGLVGVFSYNVLTPNSSLLHSVRPAVRIDFSQRNTGDDATRTTLVTPGLDIFFDSHNRLAIDLDVNVPNAGGEPTEYAVRAQFQVLI
jgi:hypothetical protein